MSYKTYDGNLYDYSPGVSCGVLIKESTMKKLARLQNEHLSAVKTLLSDEADRGNVFPSMWTLHYPKGEQTSVYFIDTDADLQQRIIWACRHDQPQHLPLVFIAENMKSAEKMADSHFYEAHQEQVK